MTEIVLNRTWIIGDKLGAGGFGEVYKATTSGDSSTYAVKLMDKLPGGDREMLFVNMDGKENIMPVVEHGETEDKYVLVMPLADYSLKEYLETHQEGLSTDESVAVINDVVDSLVSLEGSVIHSDIKPGNVLHYENKWRLADFGISKYVEASTSQNTKKDAMSAPYASPERWRHEKQTQKSDIYSLGVMSYELLSGERPFKGPEMEDYRHQHLEETPKAIDGVPPLLSSLIIECLYKPQGSRPSATSFKARLDKAVTKSIGIVIPSLQEAGLAEVERLAAEAAKESAETIKRMEKEALINVATSELEQLSKLLRETIHQNNPSANMSRGTSSSWVINSGVANLSFSPIKTTGQIDQDGRGVGFDVIATSIIGLESPQNQYGYRGRSHSLWYCDAEVEGEYGWYELAFMTSVFSGRSSRIEPFAMDPYEEGASTALTPVIGGTQQAINMRRLSSDTYEDFIVRWATMLGKSSTNGVEKPTTMPEEPIKKNYRTGLPAGYTYVH